MKKLIKAALASLIVAGAIVPAGGQSLEEILKDMAEHNAQGYLGPVVTAFGMGVNSGTFHTAKPHKLLGFDLKISVSATMVPESGQEYDFYIPEDITLPFMVEGNTYDITFLGDDLYSGPRTSATFFGKDESYPIDPDGAYAVSTIKDQLITTYGLPAAVVNAIPDATLDEAVDGLVLMTPKGFNVPGLPMLMPQFSLGLPMDIEVSLRGFPKAKIGDAGELAFYGFGGKIGLNQFIPVPVPFLPRFAAGYYLTSLKMGDIIQSNHSILTLQASKSIPFITVYGGFGIENSSMDVSYKPDPSTGINEEVKFTLEGDNKFRTIVGLRLKLLLLSIDAGVSKGEYTAYNVGVGLTLR